MAKDLRAVLFPSEFEPFPGWTVPDLAARWASNKPCVLAHMSHAAYHLGPAIASLMERFDATSHFYDVGGAQAFLAEWPDKAVVAFRGTEPRESGANEALDAFGAFFTGPLGVEIEPTFAKWLARDIIADGKFKLVPFDGQADVQVHEGFLRELDKLWPDHILPDLRALTKRMPHVPVWVTGHSLGAAMATLAGMRWPFEEVVTFGEPRVGYNIEQAFKAKRHVRYVNGVDPVTKVPPDKFLGYGHHGIERAIRDADDATSVQYDHAILYYAANLAR